MSGIPAGAGSLLGKRLGKYEILALLALGGTAEIYLARIGGAAGFEKYVVVKCLHDHLADDPEFVKMFLDEARLAAQLDHSNIVQTMELGEYENRYFMAMEFLAGLSLAMIVRRAGERLPGGRMPVPLVLNMLAQACAGLHYAHEKAQHGKPLNIVHRDISPQNLVVSFEGVVKVVDFGIAKAEHRETRTRSGTIKGKFAYMSPEQCVAANVDRRTDVFALGVILWELLTGRRLFKRPSPYETYQAVIECNVDPPSKLNVELDPALDPLVMKACAKDREARYQTAEAMGDALAGYLHHRGKGSGPGELARFFESSFAQEIDEHGARMRELISGRDFAVDTGVKWDEELEAEEKKRNETVDLSSKVLPERQSASAMSLSTSDLLPERPSAGSLTNALDELDGPPQGDEDDMPAERTRIEANPLERIAQLDAVVKNTPKPELTKRPSKPQPQQMPPSGALPLPAPPQTGGKFPALANLPTQISASDQPPAPELARTELAGPIVDAKAASDPNKTVSLQKNGQPPPARRANDEPAPGPSASSYPGMAPQTPASGPVSAQVPASGPHGQLPGPMSGQVPAQMPGQVSGQVSGQMSAQMSGQMSGQLPAQPVMTGYPVMNKALSQQIATGATVFPSDRGELASPVGPGYPETDWAAAAAAPAKRIPPWLLAVFFVAALGLALGLTIAIAKLAS